MNAQVLRNQLLEPHTGAEQISSPPSDTQAINDTQAFSTQEIHQDEIEDKDTWGWLYPVSSKFNHGKRIALKKRNAYVACRMYVDCMELIYKSCPMPGKDEFHRGSNPKMEEILFEETKLQGVASGGYLIGRHLECDLRIDDVAVSNRHWYVQVDYYMPLKIDGILQTVSYLRRYQT